MALKGRCWLPVLLLCAQAAFAQTRADAVRRYVEKRASFEISMEQLNKGLNAWDSLVRRRSEPRDVEAYGWQNFEFHHGMDAAYLAELQADLVALLGQQVPDRFPSMPNINLYTLAVHIGHPQINGLRYGSEEGDVEWIVSSVGLLKDWRPIGLSQTLAQAFDAPLASAALYDAALREGGAATVAARLPVTPQSEGQRASALLLAWPYRVDPWPTDIAIATVQGDLVYVGRKRLQTAMPTFPHCLPRYKQLNARDKYAVANEAFQACYAKAVSRHPALLQATREAQEFLALVNNSGPSQGGRGRP